eukprot:2915401-Amphidinium_carterae.1
MAHHHQNHPTKGRAVLGRPVGSADWTEFVSLKAAANHTGLSCTNIRRVCSGKLRSARGWEFRYAHEQDSSNLLGRGCRLSVGHSQSSASRFWFKVFRPCCWSGRGWSWGESVGGMSLTQRALGMIAQMDTDETKISTSCASSTVASATTPLRVLRIAHCKAQTLQRLCWVGSQTQPESKSHVSRKILTISCLASEQLWIKVDFHCISNNMNTLGRWIEFFAAISQQSVL